MFSFFKKKKPEAETPVQAESAAAAPAAEAPAEAPAQPGFLRRLFGAGDDAFVPTPETAEQAPEPEEPAAREAEVPDPAATRIAEQAASLSNGYEGQLFPETAERPGSEAEKKKSWMARLKAGLSKTSNNLSLLFVGARIDEDLYEELNRPC
jgi:fused signal recognition particle receptor